MAADVSLTAAFSTVPAAEADGVKREGVPLQLDIDQLEDAKTSAGARAQLKESLRLYFRRVLGK